MAIYNSDEYIRYLEESAARQKETVGGAYDASAQYLKAQEPDLISYYDKQRSGIYTGSRVSSLGNNERLAAYGLAGNAYAKPQSGYSESSRIRSDVNMQNALANLGTEQRGAIQSLQNAMRQIQQNKVNAIGQIEMATADKIAAVKQADAQNNVNAEKSLVDYYRSIAASGGTLTDEQKAIMSKYGYDYQQLYDIYEREQTISKQKQFAQTYLALLEGGASLTPEQASVFESVYGVPADQYKAFLTEQNQKKTADQLKTAISMGDLYFNGEEINPTSLENWKNQGLLSESQYKERLNEYQFANASIHAQKIDELTTKIANAILGGNKASASEDIQNLNKIMEEIKVDYDNKKISKAQYDDIKSDYDKFVDEANIAPSSVITGKAVYTNGNEVKPSGNRILRNVIVTVDGTSYEVELANAGSGTSTLAKELENKGLIENGQVMLHNGNIYMRVNNPDGSIFTISKLQKAEKKSAKGDYDKLKEALTQK